MKEVQLKIVDVRYLRDAIRRLSDEDVKLSASARIALALNLREVAPIAEAFERATRDKLAEIAGKNEKGRLNELSPAMQAEVETSMRPSGDAIEKLSLRTVKVDDLKLDSNPKITADVIAYLEPMLEGLDG